LCTTMDSYWSCSQKCLPSFMRAVEQCFVVFSHFLLLSVLSIIIYLRV